MNADLSRRGRFFRALRVLLLFPALALPGLAEAAPITVFFTGTDGYGVSQADAEASGIPIVFPDFVGGALDVLSVISQTVVSVVPFPPTADVNNESTSLWTVQNVLEDESGSPMALDGQTYLLFVTSVPIEIDGEPIMIDGEQLQYAPENVGIEIDPDLGWVFVAASEAAETFYYPALSLGSLAPNATAGPFSVSLEVDQPLEAVPGRRYVLPQLAIGVGFTPIPEPSTALLAAAGLVLLAAARRRRGGSDPR